MIFDLTPLKESAGGIIESTSNETLDRAKISLALENFDRIWFSLPFRRFRDSYGRLVGLLKEDKTETPVSSIRDAYLTFERYGANLCEAALRQNYGRPLDLEFSAGTLRSLVDIINSHQVEVEKAFAEG